MRIHHLNCATLCPYGRRLINGTGGLFEPARIVCHCLLIEAEGGLVLVDTGLGTEDLADPQRRLGWAWVPIMRPRLDESETALWQIQRLGLDPLDVRDIVLTHLDMDHAGGLDDFPHARVHVSIPEYAAANRPSWWKLRRYSPAQWAAEENWEFHEPIGETWFGFEAVRALPGLDPEILLIPMPGHSEGHCAVAVSTDTHWLMHCGDAFFHHLEIDPRGRRCPIGLRAYQQVYQSDSTLRLRNQARIRHLATHHPGAIEIVNSHDPLYLDRPSARAKTRQSAEPIYH